MRPAVRRGIVQRRSAGKVQTIGHHALKLHAIDTDARTLADCLAANVDPRDGLKAYEAARREATGQVVRTNRTAPPDAIIREVWQRTGDQPFTNIDDVVSREELRALSDGYKRVAGMAAPAREEDNP